MKRVLAVVSALTLVCMVLPLSAQEYWRVVQNDQIKEMNTFERAQYTKALQLVNQRQYRAAASEFERYLIQYKDSPSVPYMVFMHAFCLHQAKDRNKAIGVYNEVLDFYPDEINAAAPAMFYRGIAQLENGDYAKGMQTMKELLEDEDYRKHAVGAEAGIRLADNHFKNKEFDKAIKVLQQIVVDFLKSAPQSADNARSVYLAYCMFTGKHKEYDAWTISVYKPVYEESGKTADDAKKMLTLNAVNQLIHRWWDYYHDRESKYTGGKKGTDPASETWLYLNDNKQAFVNLKDEWSYYWHALYLLSGRPTALPAQDFENLVREAAASVAKGPEDTDEAKKNKENAYAELTNRLLDGWRASAATFMNSKIKDPKTRAWNEYRILEKEEKWNEALKHLDTISATYSDDAAFVKNCNWSKAYIMKDRTRNYDEAIKVFNSISELPRTLWEVSDCQWRKGDLAACTKTLIEIENAFPNDAPEAAWRRAQYQDQSKNSEMAIKECRAIMKKYPKSNQSSQAHQMLERYGIDTGGAVIDGDE